MKVSHSLFRVVRVSIVAVLATAFAPSIALAACDMKVKPATYAQFKECVFKEPGTGIYIVDGDVPVVGEDALRKFYAQMLADAASSPSPSGPMTPGRGAKPITESLLTPSGRNSVDLIVNRVNNADDVWAKAKSCGLNYCISRATTGTRYQQVVDAMSAASQAWSTNLGIRMNHDASQDNACSSSNNAVDFDVQVVSGMPYIARAFFPAQARATRNVNIDMQAFSVTPPLTLTGALRHELGHALGFRHEHTRPEAGQCFEDNNWRALTPYDSTSVMHYPQCGGTAGWGLELSARDIAGGIALYGNSSVCVPAPTGSPVSCRVFNDGYQSASALAQATYFRANSSVCIPDGTASGTCRKWFGRCETASSERVNFTVFNDGASAKSAPSDAVYIPSANKACTPDGTAAGNCRRWVGLPTTASGKRAQCFLFDDGFRNAVGPTDAIYAKAPNQFCMPDGSSSGVCRRWFGKCQVP